ncbi:MAG: DUF4190 domain-containing protein [Limisphaerales bacterium]
MSAIYKIIGDNGQEYGPVAGEQIRQWILQGRIERQTPVFVDGAKDWNFIGLLPEFAAYFPAVGITNPPPIAPPPDTTTAGKMAKTNSYAMWGMIFGILSLVCCCCGFPFGILGLIFSLIGLSQINANPQLYQGRGMAITGLILSILSLLMGAGSMFFNLVTSQPHVMWHTGQF